MPSPVRVGATRGGRGATSKPQTATGTTSGYGETTTTSVGYNPRNPYAFMGAQNAKSYPKTGPFSTKDTLKKYDGDPST